MTIKEALEESKESGQHYSRLVGSEWIHYLRNFIYRLSVEDLMADDWEPTGVFQSKYRRDNKP